MIFNHNDGNIAKALGVSEPRAYLLKQAIMEAVKDGHNTTYSLEIEAVCKAIPRITGAEYVLIGLHIAKLHASIDGVREAIEAKIGVLDMKPRTLIA